MYHQRAGSPRAVGPLSCADGRGMMTRATSSCLLLCLLPVGCAGWRSDRVVIDDLLHRPDARHGTLGPSGKRLFAERLDEGLGFRGQFSYIHYAKIADPIMFQPLENSATNIMFTIGTFLLLAFTRIPSPLIIAGGLLLGFVLK